MSQRRCHKNNNVLLSVIEIDIEGWERERIITIVTMMILMTRESWSDNHSISDVILMSVWRRRYFFIDSLRVGLLCFIVFILQQIITIIFPFISNSVSIFPILKNYCHLSARFCCIGMIVENNIKKRSNNKTINFFLFTKRYFSTKLIY